MSRTVHLSQSITGPLMNWKRGDWVNATKWITRNDGTKYTADELKLAFLEELAKGHKCIPIGACDNFDFERGCRGHPILSPSEPAGEAEHGARGGSGVE